MIGFIDAFFVQSLLFAINPALPLIYSLHKSLDMLFVSWQRIYEYNTRTITSNQYEVFLPVLLQSPWNADPILQF
jgi:hypothetical protein